MTSYKVDISKARVERLNLITDTEAKTVLGKGWTLPFVYSFQEIRDVFLAFYKNGQNGTVAEFSNKYVKGVIPPVRSSWDDKGRRVLEIKNALINFGLMDQQTLRCKEGVFEEVVPGTLLSDADLQVFREIFFHYFRFQEYSSLFVTPDMTTTGKLALAECQLVKRSKVLYYFGSTGNRIDSFFYTLAHPALVYKFPTDDKGVVKGSFMRFWDTFLSWSSQLGLVERINMKRQGYLLADGKSFNAGYFINPGARIDVAGVLSNKFKRQLMVDISELVMEICFQFRSSIGIAQQAVIDYYLANSDNVSLIRTSEIFIKETELNRNDRILYPKYKGSFVSHIKLRRYE